MAHNVTNPVNVTITPQRVPSETSSASVSSAGLSADMRDMISSMVQQAMQQMQQQMAAELSMASNRRTISDTLHVAPSGERVGEYSASASIKQPPVVNSQHRATDVRRQSMGIPSNPFTPNTAATPAPPQRRVTTAAVRMVSLNEGAEDEDSSPTAAALAAATLSASDDGMPKYDPRLARVRKSITSIIKPFHGQTELDTYNVLDWVEKLDTEFSVQMGSRQVGRLDIVRSVLAGSALRWMNEKVQELQEKEARGELSEDIEWEALRKPFIDVHLGVNTIETFKSKLRALRLGSAETLTPVELNQEFDHLAGLAYPDRRSEMRETVLGDEYSKIIAASDMTIFKSVAYNQNPSKIEEWKLHVSRRWATGKNVEAVEAQLRGSLGGGGRGGRGAYQRYNDRTPATDKPTAASAASMSSTNDAGQEGQQGDEDGDSDQQLSAADSKRGGGAGKAPKWTDEQTRLYRAGLCFKCKQSGHRQKDCPTLAAAAVKGGKQPK